MPFDDPIIRPLLFAGLLVLFAALEMLRPKRQWEHRRAPRWISNIGILFVGTFLARLILPIAPVGVAVWAVTNDFGLFNIAPFNPIFAGIMAFVVLDLLIYFQHRIFHAVPQLWRIHRMHHTDLDFDVTTALRFHPIEIFLSLIIKMIAVALIGAHPLAVVVFEVVLNGTALFNHSNLSLPLQVDRALRLGVVTPDMHRVHHSVRAEETNSNFGFNLPWWDRLFGTYRAQPTDGHKDMTIGLDVFRDARATRLVQLIIQPFVSDAAATGVASANETARPQRQD